MVTLKQIANEVGVSVATVSLYVNDNSTKRISAETKQKIRKALDEMHYLPNESARNLRQKRTKSVGIIMPFQGTFLRSSFIAEMVSGIQSVLFRNDYSFSFLPATSKNMAEVVEPIIANHNRYDGYIIIGTRYSTKEDVRQAAKILKSHKLKFVVMNMPHLGLEVNQVLANYSALMTPIRYLEDMGHSQILIMHGVKTSPDSVYVQEQLKNIGRIYPEIFGAYEREIAKTAIESYVASKGMDFTAIYCLTDTMALGVYDYARENGISIPGDISVVGRNDSYFDTLITPNLTTVRRNAFVEGEKAATILLTCFDNDTPLISAVQGELIVRDSVKSIVNK